jgi:hypothetical protein
MYLGGSPAKPGVGGGAPWVRRDDCRPVGRDVLGAGHVHAEPDPQERRHDPADKRVQGPRHPLLPGQAVRLLVRHVAEVTTVFGGLAWVTMEI